MSESTMGTNKKILDILTDILKSNDGPMQAYKIHHCLLKRKVKMEISRLRYHLHYYSKQRNLIMYKIPGMPAYYCLPEWFKDKELSKKIANGLKGTIKL